MPTITQLDHRLGFPNTEAALDDPNGLLAFGGDLSPERLMLAYSSGIFPWFSENEPIMWWSPDPRGVLLIDDFAPSKSLRKFVRTCEYTISINKAFDQVIDTCASIPRHDSGTWITQDMIDAYKELHQLGHAHSVEVWRADILVGGLYGVAVGKVFCGESMFHKVSNASKLATVKLVEILAADGAKFIDCQMQNPHLESLGCIEVSRSVFLTQLSKQRQLTFSKNVWQPRILEADL